DDPAAEAALDKGSLSANGVRCHKVAPRADRPGGRGHLDRERRLSGLTGHSWWCRRAPLPLGAFRACVSARREWFRKGGLSIRRPDGKQEQRANDNRLSYFATSSVLIRTSPRFRWVIAGRVNDECGLLAHA